MPIVLAHGALGAFDEIIFLSIALVFVVMMAWSWLRSQQLPDEDDEAAAEARANGEQHFELE